MTTLKARWQSFSQRHPHLAKMVAPDETIAGLRLIKEGVKDPTLGIIGRTVGLPVGAALVLGSSVIRDAFDLVNEPIKAAKGR